MPITYWYYNSTTGAVVQFPAFYPFPVLHMGLGWHGPFNSQDAANAFYRDNHGANPGWKAPSSVINQITDLPNEVSTQIGNTGKAIQHEFFHGVDLQAWFIRIGEVLLGLILVGVGLAKLTGTTNFVMDTIKKVPIPL